MGQPTDGDERQITYEAERKHRYAETTHPGRGAKFFKPRDVSGSHPCCVVRVRYICVLAYRRLRPAAYRQALQCALVLLLAVWSPSFAQWQSVHGFDPGPAAVGRFATWLHYRSSQSPNVVHRGPGIDDYRSCGFSVPIKIPIVCFLQHAREGQGHRASTGNVDGDPNIALIPRV